MREILFRGKSVSNNEWVEGFYEYSYIYDSLRECHRIIWVDKPTRTNYLSEVIPETVGQFTGLYDKNSKKIFEGDIVTFESHGYMPRTDCGKVIFKDGCYGIEYNCRYFGLIFHRIGKVDKWQDMSASGEITYTYEVIGNIHDTPELLERSENGKS